MTKTCTKKDYEGYDEAMAYFEQLDEEEERKAAEDFDNISLVDDKYIYRKRRKNDRKAKARQLKLANSVKRKRKSKYRWNPVWHKMKLSDVSPKLLKDRSSGTSTNDALKEFKMAGL